jgi:hypothetical protein
MNLRYKFLARDLFLEHPEQVVYMTCNEAFFVDLVSNPHHRARVHRLGLAHPDRVFSLLGLVLHPSDLVRQAAWQVVGRSREGGCGILALQVRKGTPETSAYSVLDPSDLDLFWQAARKVEASMRASPRAWPCVHWIVSSDDAEVVAQARRAHGHGDEVLWYEGSVTHIDHHDVTEMQLQKLFVDHYLLSIAEEIIITIPSSFGFTARLLNRTRATHLHVLVSARYREVIPDSLALGKRAASDAYMCGALDVCFCGPVGIAGDMCPKHDKSVTFHLRLHDPEVIGVASAQQIFAHHHHLDSPESSGVEAGVVATGIVPRAVRYLASRAAGASESSEAGVHSDSGFIAVNMTLSSQIRIWEDEDVEAPLAVVLLSSQPPVRAPSEPETAADTKTDPQATRGAMDLAADAHAPLAMVEVWLGEEELMSESIDKACRSNYSTALHLGQPAVPDMCTLSILVPCELLRRQLQHVQQDMWEDARVELGAMVWSVAKPWIKSVVKLRLCPSLCAPVNTPTHSKENTSHTHKELHGEHHPPVAIRFGAEPLVAIGQGRMELRFLVVGALVGFKYRIVLQEADILVHRVIQQQEISFSPTEDSASNEITAELAIMDSTKTELIRFAIGVWDAHEGLSEEEALVAGKDATFPLLKREHALTTDNAAEWYGASPPTPPPAAAAPLATAPTRPRHVHGPVGDAKNNQCGDERISTRTRVFLKAGRAHVLPEVYMYIHTKFMIYGIHIPYEHIYHMANLCKLWLIAPKFYNYICTLTRIHIVSLSLSLSL